MALVVFRSKAAAEIFMFAETAQRMLQIIGKAEADRGVIRGPDLDLALQRLVDAVESEKSALRDAQAQRERDDRGGSVGGGAALPPITLGQRAFPLIEMLRAASRKGVDVTWGV
jgi:hypothetical protein